MDMMNDFAFQMYIAEQEGWLDTREGRLNKMRKLLEQGYNIAEAAEESDIDVKSLSYSEMQKIGINYNDIY